MLFGKALILGNKSRKSPKNPSISRHAISKILTDPDYV
jgi:hypothetical protein